MFKKLTYLKGRDVVDISKRIDSIASAIVDNDFYLSKYPDVKLSGFDPVKHYVQHGRYEGRIPCRVEASEYEPDLWVDHSALALKMIERLADTGSDIEAAFSNWILARYYHYIRNGRLATEYLSRLWKQAIRGFLFPHDGPLCLAYELTDFYGSDELREIRSADSFRKVANENVARIIDSRNQPSWGEWSNFLHLPVTQNLSLKTFDSLRYIKSNRSLNKKEKVSIVIPVYNGQSTLGTSLTSLINQTWKNIEVIVVNDASTDKTIETFYELVGSDPRFSINSLNENRGAYYARNTGVDLASGDYITVMDADDWAHPEKIEKQIKSILNEPFKKASLSYLVRSTNELAFTHWRMETGWIQPNISSLMLKRDVIKKIGYWDEVKAGADTEYINRFLKRFGDKSLVHVQPNSPLSICRVSSRSLTSDSDTGIATFLKGARADYFAAFSRWHNTTPKRKLFIPLHADSRRFSSPLAMQKHKASAFDEQWYMDAYGDVARAKVDPKEHYSRYGHLEGREPSPHSVLSAFPLVKSEKFETIKSTTTLPIFKGRKKYSEELPTYLFFGHMFGETIYGAERSLADLISSQQGRQVNIVVILPAGCNESYLKQLLNFSCYVHLVPMPHWRANRGLNTAVISNLEKVVKSYMTVLCYINTLTLWEPVVAAKSCGVPAVMHVREIPENDKELCRYLHATPKKIAEHLNSLTCSFWANSMKTFEWLLNSRVSQKKIELLYNGIDVKNLSRLTNSLPKEREVETKLVVGMLSNNSPKKGIRDFFRIQQSLKHTGISFKLFGAKTKYIKLHNQVNYEYLGYVNGPADALEHCDVILCLSHVQESFGRTAAEAMAAGRVVIAYDWGALGEVVGDAGILVRKGDVTAVSDALIELSDNQSLVKSYSAKAKKRAEIFSLEKLGDNFVRLSDKILNG